MKIISRVTTIQIEGLEVYDPDLLRWLASLAGWKLSPGTEERRVYVHRLLGADGTAGVAMVVEGSPAKLIVVIDQSGQHITVTRSGRSSCRSACNHPKLWREAERRLRKLGIETEGRRSY